MTDKQADRLQWIRDYIAEHGYAPSLRNMGEAWGIRSTNGVSDVLRALRARGLVRWDPKVARSLRVTGGEWWAR